jgi:hypothetical protein
MTSGDWISLAGVTATIVIAAVSGGWALHRSRKGSPSPENEAQPALEEGAVPPDVRWRIEHRAASQYVLRNIGGDVAEHVRVDESQAPPLNRGLPKGISVQPNEGVTMLLKGSWQRPMPNQLRLRWAGQPDWVAVPIN